MTKVIAKKEVAVLVAEIQVTLGGSVGTRATRSQVCARFAGKEINAVGRSTMVDVVVTRVGWEITSASRQHSASTLLGDCGVKGPATP